MIGMLWLDNDPNKPLETKIKEAVAYYQEKNGKAANTVYINPKEANGILPVLPGVKIGLSKSVLIHHFFVGVE